MVERCSLLQPCGCGVKLPLGKKAKKKRENLFSHEAFHVFSNKVHSPVRAGTLELIHLKSVSAFYEACLEVQAQDSSS